MIGQDFFITSMPSSRPADYYLGYLDGSVFLDFNNVNNNQICLKRISFDGYGCCELADDAIPLNEEDSENFKENIQDEIKDQITLGIIVKKSISLNKMLIWTEALEEWRWEYNHLRPHSSLNDYTPVEVIEMSHKPENLILERS